MAQIWISFSACCLAYYTRRLQLERVEAVICGFARESRSIEQILADYAKHRRVEWAEAPGVRDFMLTLDELLKLEFAEERNGMVPDLRQMGDQRWVSLRNEIIWKQH